MSEQQFANKGICFHTRGLGLAIILILGLSIWPSCSSNEGEPIKAQGELTRLITVHASADVSIVEEAPPRLAHVKVIPQHVVLYPGEVATFRTAAYDQHGREIQGVNFHWQLLDPNAGSITTSGVFKSGFNVGTFNDAFRLVTTPPAGSGSAPVEATATVTIINSPGTFKPASIRVIPDQVEMTPGQSFQLMAYVFDLNGTVVANTDLKWEVVHHEAGSITQDGLFRAGNETGTILGAIQVTLLSEEQRQKSDISAVADVVIHDPSAVVQDISAILLPTVVSLSPGQYVKFNVLVMDRQGNQLAPEEIVWEVKDQTAGTIDDSGMFNGGEKPGIYTDVLKARLRILLGDELTTIEAGATVVVVEVPEVVTERGKLKRVAIFPEIVILSPGESTSLSIVSIDGNGHQLTDIVVSWTVDPSLGRITQTGIITAANAPGIYEGAINVEVSQTGQAKQISETVSAGLTIRGDLARTEIIPGKATLPSRGIIRFRAVGYDKDGTPVDHARVSWKVSDSEAGTIDPNGVFTAGLRHGQYPGTVVAEMEQELRVDSRSEP